MSTEILTSRLIVYFLCFVNKHYARVSAEAEKVDWNLNCCEHVSTLLKYSLIKKDKSEIVEHCFVWLRSNLSKQ